MTGWTKMGLAFSAPGAGLMYSHAMLPTPLVLADRIRIYFASCDADLRGRVFRLDVAREDPCRIIELDMQPALDLGPSGSFDADGVNPSQVIMRDGQLLMYYIGWQRISAELPYRLFTGLAVSNDGGERFHRLSERPVLPATEQEPFFRTAPHVFRTAAGWGMLYIGGGKFFDGAAGKRLPTYGLRYVASPDGTKWSAYDVRQLLEPDPARCEIGFGRPVFWHDGVEHRLFLSIRTEMGYRLASLDGEPAPTGGWPDVLGGDVACWESEMTCFGAPCRVGNTEYLFYNGNQFGRTGFGLAGRVARDEAVGAPLDLIAKLEALQKQAEKKRVDKNGGT